MPKAFSVTLQLEIAVVADSLEDMRERVLDLSDLFLEDIRNNTPDVGDFSIRDLKSTPSGWNDDNLVYRMDDARPASWTKDEDMTVADAIGLNIWAN